MKKKRLNPNVIKINLNEITLNKNYSSELDHLFNNEGHMIWLIIIFGFDDADKGKALARSLIENGDFIIDDPFQTNGDWFFEAKKLIEAEQVKKEIEEAEELTEKFSCRFVDWLVESPGLSI